MNIISTYSVKIKDHNQIFRETVRIYRSAVSFFIDVGLKEWDAFKDVASNQNAYVRQMEVMTIPTAGRETVKHDFTERFPGMPNYLRRAAIAEAIGRVSSHETLTTRIFPFPSLSCRLRQLFRF